MGTSTREMFGGDPVAQPATPGSYGLAPMGHRLPAQTRLGRVVLQVSDLARSLAYYEHVLGFRMIARGEGRAALGAADAIPLVELVERRGARAMTARGRLGLYHVAILLPDRPSLGRFVRHLADAGVRAGAGDHLVSEAFYLHDPDGLGLEIYADRPRAEWQRVGRELVMATDPVEVADLLRGAGDAPWVGMPAGTRVGHVHLHVGDITAATAFFSDGLGFDRTVWRYPGALFLSAGGYHHHVGANTWAGAGARVPQDDDARLLEWTVELPDARDVQAVADGLTRAGYAIARADAGDLIVTDPWGTRVRVRVADVDVAFVGA